MFLMSDFWTPQFIGWRFIDTTIYCVRFFTPIIPPFGNPKIALGGTIGCKFFEWGFLECCMRGLFREVS